MRMSVTPICASTVPSTSSTIEWMMDWGWTSTSIFEASTPKSQRASMTSRPLFMRVAESIVILGPMRQVGCARASSRVMRSKLSRGRLRKGPPEAVRMSRRTSCGRRPSRHSCRAQCSLEGRCSACSLV